MAVLFSVGLPHRLPARGVLRLLGADEGARKEVRVPLDARNDFTDLKEEKSSDGRSSWHFRCLLHLVHTRDITKAHTSSSTLEKVLPGFFFKKYLFRCAKSLLRLQNL